MLDTEGQWSEALASNNIRSIIRWLESLSAEGDAHVEKILPAFSCWVQRTSEFAKKELLTLCFSRCQGLWMFLDRSSFSRVHVLLQRLRNLLTLAQWAPRRLCSAHLWHGVGVPCVICRDWSPSSEVWRGCWTRAHRTLKQHIWLGQLVQWWGIMGLLPKLPEAQEVKRISQMWRDMELSHRRALLESHGDEREEGSFGSLIQGMVMHLNRQHGCIWTCEDGADQCYPPPNLQGLLKLVLLPRIDNVSVQAILMYFIQDVANFLQCRDDLLQSFCLAFSIPSSFSQQIKAFWMFDHGHIKASMDVLLSPRSAVPSLSWQHRCIVLSLLKRKQPRVALKYLQWTRPTIQTPEDAKLCADVCLQSSCVSEAWALLKKGHSESQDMVLYFIQACEGLSLCAEALKYIPAGHNGNKNYTVETEELLQRRNDCGAEKPPRPLSASLYQAQTAGALSSDDLVRLVRRAVMEVREPRPGTSGVVWPRLAEEKPRSREVSLSAQALRHLSISPPPMDTAEEPHTPGPEDQPPAIHHLQLHPGRPELLSSSEDLRSVSASSLTSASSPTLLKRGHSYVYERTLTLQRISSLLTDGENQSSEGEEGEEEEEEEEEEGSDTPPSTDGSSDRDERTQTPDDATDSVRDDQVKILLSTEETVFPGGDQFSFQLLSSEPSTDESVPNTSFRVNVQPADSQSEPDVSLPDGGGSASAVQELHTDWITSQIFSSTSDCVPERKVQQKVRELHRQEKLSSIDEPSEAPDPRQSPEEPPPRPGDPESCLLSSVFPTLLQITSITGEGVSESGPKRDQHSRLDGWTRPSAAGASPDNRRSSFVSGQPYSYGHFLDFNAKLKGEQRDVKQAEQEEAAGWSVSGKASQGAIRTGRAASRRGKRLKRT